MVRKTMAYVSRFMWKCLFLIEVEVQLGALFPPLLIQPSMEITAWQRRGWKTKKRGNSNTQDEHPSWK